MSSMLQRLGTVCYRDVILTDKECNRSLDMLISNGVCEMRESHMGKLGLH